nr:hypothetical protein [Tanacetum cinerariifolium]
YEDFSVGGNNAKASGSASRQAQQTEPALGHDGSGGSSPGAVIGLSAAAGEGCACVASQDMLSEVVEQRMYTNVSDEIDGAKGEHLPNHVVKKGNLEFLVCKVVGNPGVNEPVDKGRPLKRKMVYVE